MFKFLKKVIKAYKAQRLENYLYNAWFRAFLSARKHRVPDPETTFDPLVLTPHGVISQDVFLDIETKLVFGITVTDAIDIGEAILLRGRDAAARLNGERVTGIWHTRKIEHQPRLYHSPEWMSI